MDDEKIEEIGRYRDILKTNPFHLKVAPGTYLRHTKVLLDRIDELEDLLDEERHG